MNAEISETIEARKSRQGMHIVDLFNSSILFQKGATTTLMPTKAYKAITCLQEVQKTSFSDVLTGKHQCFSTSTV